MTEENQTETEDKPRRRGRRRREVMTYVVCVRYPGEWEQLVALAQEKFDGCQPVQEIPLARLTDDCEVRAGFFLGDSRHGTPRTPYFTEPVAVSDHWTPGAGGLGGDLRRNSFLEELGKLCMPNGGKLGGVSIKPGGDTLKVAYG